MTTVSISFWMPKLYEFGKNISVNISCMKIQADQNLGKNIWKNLLSLRVLTFV